MQITKPRTQRRNLFQAPAHRRHRYFSAPLSPHLKKKHGTNAVPVKMGDTVRVLRGDRRGFEGKITKVNYKKYKIFVEGVTREKADGTTTQVPIHPSKVMIITLNLDDKRRREALKRKGMFLEEPSPPPTEAVVKEKEAEKKLTAKKTVKKPPRKKKKKGKLAKSASEKAKKTGQTEKQGKKRTRKTKTEKGAE